MYITRALFAGLASFAVTTAVLGLGPAHATDDGARSPGGSTAVELRAAATTSPAGIIEQPIIAGNGVRIHTQPSTSSTVVGLGYYGDKVYDLEYIPGWEKIKLYRDGVTGWIAAQYLGTEPIVV